MVLASQETSLSLKLRPAHLTHKTGSKKVQFNGFETLEKELSLKDFGQKGSNEPKWTRKD